MRRGQKRAWLAGGGLGGAEEEGRAGGASEEGPMKRAPVDMLLGKSLWGEPYKQKRGCVSKEVRIAEDGHHGYLRADVMPLTVIVAD